MKSTVTKELQETLEQNPHIEDVHFTADGHHHFRAFQHGKDMYTRLAEVPEKSKTGIYTGKHVLAPIKNIRNEDHEAHKIVESVSREEVLSATPVAKEPVSGLVKQGLVETLAAMDPEEVKALFAQMFPGGAPVAAKKK